MNKLLTRFEEYLAGLLLAAIALLIVVQLVLTRLAPRLSSPLTTVVLGLFVWASMLGVPAATRRGGHLGLLLVGRHVAARWQSALRLLLLVASLAFFLTLTVTGVGLCWEQVAWRNRFVGARWPAWVVTVSIPLAAGLSCVRAVEAWLLSRPSAAGSEGE